jgi:hypothetical protein
MDLTLEFFENKMSGLGFNDRETEGTFEIVFSREIPDTGLSVVVFSSIDIRTGEIRETGTDAIRVTLWNDQTNRPIKVEKRVNRVGKCEDILERVAERAREIWKLGIDKARNTDENCDKCREQNIIGMMVERKIKRGAKKGKTFLGCSNFPLCRNTIWEN